MSPVPQPPHNAVVCCPGLPGVCSNIQKAWPMRETEHGKVASIDTFTAQRLSNTLNMFEIDMWAFLNESRAPTTA